MKLQIIDIAILVAYLVLMVLIGWFLRKKARQNKESYLLGGKKLPWYLLGLALDRQNLPGEARHALECSLALAPDFADARAELERLSSRRDLPPETAAPPVPCRL